MWIRACALVVVLSLLGGIVDRNHLLKIPKVGYVFYALSGGKLAPYNDYNTFDDDSWLQSGDVVVAVGTKCGTNWVATIVHELRTWNLDQLRDFEDISDVVPWVELKHYPGETMEKRVHNWAAGKSEKWNTSEYKFREFKTHATPVGSDELFSIMDVRKRTDVKFIAMAREGKDVLNSMYFFVDNLSAEFTRMWGGFPPTGGSFEDFFAFNIPSEKILILKYVLRWWEYRNDPNVLLLHRRDLMKNPRLVVRKIANFVGITDISDQAFERVLERVSFKFMQARDNKYRYRFGYNLDKRIMLPNRNATMREGGSGSWKRKFSDAQLRIWEAHRQALLGHDPRLMRWAEEGGEF
mmetsp:Transcript_36504/g.58822  ORF Transcript_36504/g.58822 Transcript_36504/m.58822 type:complete len:352 (-) Transcript_36504:4650-5705(-)